MPGKTIDLVTVDMIQGHLDALEVQRQANVKAGVNAQQAAVYAANSAAAMQQRVNDAIQYVGPAYSVVADYPATVDGYIGGPYSGFGWQLPQPNGPFDRVRVQAADIDSAHPTRNIRWRFRQGNQVGPVLAEGTLSMSLSTVYQPVLLIPSTPLTLTGPLWIEVASDGYLGLRRQDTPVAGMVQTRTINDGNPDTNPDGQTLWGDLGAQTTFAAQLQLTGNGSVVELGEPMTSAIQKANIGLPALAIPPVLYGVEGIELNVFWETAYLWPTQFANYSVVVSGYGTNKGTRWTVTPTAADAGEHQLTVKVYDREKNLLRTDLMTARISPANAGSGTASFVGISDSNWKRGWMAGGLQEFFNGSSGLQLIQRGTWVTEVPQVPQVYNEGHPGWTVQAYWVRTDQPGPDGQSNPMWNPGAGTTDSKFDFSYYQNSKINYNLSEKDAVGWMLGVNSMDDPLYYNLIQREMTMLKELARRVHISCGARQFVATQIPHARNPAAVYQEQLPQVYSRAIMDAFAGVDYVEVLAFGVMVDRDTGFSYVDEAASAYTPDQTVRVPNDYVHVIQPGGKMAASAIYGWLKWWSWH